VDHEAYGKLLKGLLSPPEPADGPPWTHTLVPEYDEYDEEDEGDDARG
jgi:hypothetical protein